MTYRGISRVPRFANFVEMLRGIPIILDVMKKMQKRNTCWGWKWWWRKVRSIAWGRAAMGELESSFWNAILNMGNKLRYGEYVDWVNREFYVGKVKCTSILLVELCTTIETKESSYSHNGNDSRILFDVWTWNRGGILDGTWLWIQNQSLVISYSNS